MEEKKPGKKIKKVSASTVAKAFGISVVFYFVAVGLLVYFRPLTSDIFKNKIIAQTIEFVPYPVALVGTKMITAQELLFELNAAKHFYENQDYSELGLRVDFSTQDGEKRLRIKEKEILNKLVENRVIEAEAKKRDISVNQEMVDQEVNRKLKEYGTGDYLKNNLEKLYGWNIEDFKEYIVRPDLYKEKLLASFQKNEKDDVASKEKIEKAKVALSAGAEFSQVAREYSEGDSAKDGGSLGWFKPYQMIPEVAIQAHSLEKGKTSEIIESPIGFHIVKVEDKKTEDGEEMIKVSQVFARVESFGEWLEKTQKNYEAHSTIFEFKWNKETSRLDFRDENMVEYEKDLSENPVNDPSVTL